MNATNRAVRLLLVTAISGTTACSDALGPVDSVPITLTVNSMNASDVEAGIIEKDENISTETGNPWGEFIRIAEGQCGASPAAFEVLSASITLDVAGSSDVQAFEDVISGEARVFFASTQGSDASAVRVNVASAASVSGVGPVVLPVIATRSQLSVLHERLLGGDFHVGLNAETNRTDADSFSMDVRISLQARALCE